MPAPQSAHENAPLVGSHPSLTTPGSWFCTLKIRFDVGKSIPRMTCARLPNGCTVAARGAAAGGAAAGGAAAAFGGNVIGLSAASSVPSAAWPAGNFPTCRMYAAYSAACSLVVDPGES